MTATTPNKRSNADKKLLAASLVLMSMVLFAPNSAHAQSATANLAVSATVAANCTISTTPVAFGSYDPVVANATTALTSAGTVVITCTRGSAPNLTLAAGNNPSAGVRRMSSGADFLAYDLYQPPTTVPGAACSYTSPTAWGTTAAQTFTPTVAPSRSARTYNVCGSVPAGQDVGIGAYSDTVVATVNF